MDAFSTEIRRIVREEVKRALEELHEESQSLPVPQPPPLSAPEAPAIDLKRWLTPEEVSRYLGVAPQTLANWRSSSAGPESRRAGRLVRYWGEDVEAFIRGSE
jgi:DNA-binding transcriptional regulator YiaG